MSEVDLDRPATLRDLMNVRDELRTHFDVVAEQFKPDFKNLFDWTQTTTSTMGARIDRLEGKIGNRR